jgi:GTPase SAR1 family protein
MILSSQKQPLIEMNTFNIAIVGSAGKTTFIERIKNRNYSPSYSGPDGEGFFSPNIDRLDNLNLITTVELFNGVVHMYDFHSDPIYSTEEQIDLLHQWTHIRVNPEGVYASNQFEANLVSTCLGNTHVPIIDILKWAVCDAIFIVSTEHNDHLEYEYIARLLNKPFLVVANVNDWNTVPCSECDEEKPNCICRRFNPLDAAVMNAGSGSQAENMLGHLMHLTSFNRDLVSVWNSYVQ